MDYRRKDVCAFPIIPLCASASCTESVPIGCEADAFRSLLSLPAFCSCLLCGGRGLCLAILRNMKVMNNKNAVSSDRNTTRDLDKLLQEKQDTASYFQRAKQDLDSLLERMSESAKRKTKSA